MGEIEVIEKLFMEVMNTGKRVLQLDLSVEHISQLTEQITNPNKNVRMVM